jgi:hypothetical protein
MTPVVTVSRDGFLNNRLMIDQPIRRASGWP